MLSRPAVAILGTVLPLLAAGPAASAAGRTERVSVGASGQQGDARSLGPAISAGGRFVAFVSEAANLVGGDANGAIDVFLRDRQARTTTLVSVSSTGARGNGGSSSPRVSRLGRQVAFVSAATNLVPNAAGARPQVYVRDLAAGTTTLVSAGTRGEPADSFPNIPLAIAAEGRFVAFISTAGNLVPGAGGDYNLFLRDLATGVTTLEARIVDGTTADEFDFDAAITPDGRFLAFRSFARDVVPGRPGGLPEVLLRDRRTGRTTLVSEPAGSADGFSGGSAVSDDGAVVAFWSTTPNLVPGDRNGQRDAFVRDLRTGRTTRVSVAAGGGEADGPSVVRGMSADGRFVLLYSSAANLVRGDTNGRPDFFVRDRRAGTTTRVNVTSRGGQATGPGTGECCGGAGISADGRVIAFESEASNLVPGDTNGARDVFAHVRMTSTGR